MGFVDGIKMLEALIDALKNITGNPRPETHDWLFGKLGSEEQNPENISDNGQHQNGAIQPKSSSNKRRNKQKNTETKTHL
jgi:hypothetical protein